MAELQAYTDPEEVYGQLIVAQKEMDSGIDPYKTGHSSAQVVRLAKTAYVEMRKPRATLSASEALFGFVGWLTSRAEVVTFSEVHDASVAVELLKTWCEHNGLANPRDGWELLFEHPVTNSAPETVEV